MPNQQQTTVKLIAEDDPHDVLSRLHELFTQEQIYQVIDALERIQGRAIERHSDQSLTITFNDKGLPRHINGSDNVTFVKPKIYLSE